MFGGVIIPDAQPGVQVQSPRMIRFSTFEINLQTCEVRKSGHRIALQEQPFRVLSMLLERPDQVVTREEIRQKLWGSDTFVDFDHGLNTAINKIREVFEDSARVPRFIETLPRQGYRFIAPVEVVTDDVDEPIGLKPAAAQRPQAGLAGSGRISRRMIWSANVCAGLTIAAAIVYLVHTWARPETSEFSIAVLPFANLTGNADQEYFSDGLTEELISALSNVTGLRVVSRTSCLQFKNRTQDIRAIGTQLNVGKILDGAVRSTGDRVRITAELINVADGFHLWSETYDRRNTDIFAIQEAIARAVVDALRMKLPAALNRPLVQHQTPNLRAHDLYLMGRHLLDQRTPEEVERAKERFQQAIAIDPRYALAYAGLADSYGLLAAMPQRPLREIVSLARVAAQRALELDESLAEAHTALAGIKISWEWDFQGAEYECRRAIELNPTYATARYWYACYLTAMERFDEANREINHAIQSDPLSLAVHLGLVGLTNLQRQYDRALQYSKELLDLDPNSARAHYLIGRIYLGQGRYRQAIASLGRAVDLAPSMPLYAAYLAHAYARSGDRSEAARRLKVLLEQSQIGYVAPFNIALVYVGLGERDLALDWLEKAFAEGPSVSLTYSRVDPDFDSIRSDPRFIGLLKRSGLLPARSGR